MLTPAAQAAYDFAVGTQTTTASTLANARARLAAGIAATDAANAAAFATRMTLANYPLAVANPALSHIDFAQYINGYLYVVAEYDNRFVQHHYFDGNPDSRVLDNKCPHTDIVTYGASKVYCADGQDVVFCSVSNPRDWQIPLTAASTSTGGMIAVGRQQSAGAIIVSAIGMFKGMLAVFFDDSLQLWSVDPNPANDRKIDALAAGCAHKLSLANMTNDLFFFSHNGVRSITRAQSMASNWMDFDVGSQVDALTNEVRGNDSMGDYTQAIYLGMLGQYWIWRASAGKTIAYVFSFSQSVGLSAWSRYEFGMAFDAIVQLNGLVYIRSGGNVYTLDADVFTDAGVPIPVQLDTAFVDMQSPNLLKQVYALDYVTQGTAQLQFKYDPRNPSYVTPPITISGDSRPSALTSVELCSTHAALSLTHNADEAFELSAFTLYYNKLGER